MATTARVAALRLLALRRLTEAQLRQKLELRGYTHEDIADAVVRCKQDGYLDDRLFAALYVAGPRKAVGDRRLVAELVKRGIDRIVAQEAVTDAPADESARIRDAYERLQRGGARSYQSAARGLERLGFPTSKIYRLLRAEAAAALPGLATLDTP